MQVWLDCVLVALLGVTLFHALRLQAALGRLKRDRESLDLLLENFGASTRAAETGIGKLRALNEEAGRQNARQAELGNALKDDLGFLIERGDLLADRLDSLVRTARPLAADAPRPPVLVPVALPPPIVPRAAFTPPRMLDPEQPQEGPRMRSQAERDLLQALRATR